VRTEPQAEGLARTLASLGRAVTAVLLFEVPDEELVRRLGGRTVCEGCQTPYTEREPGSACERCGGTLVRRKDDEPAAIRNRLGVYQAQTEPVIGWYRRQGTPMLAIDATGAVDEVTGRALEALRRLRER
jgi:adenylate kinase